MKYLQTKRATKTEVKTAFQDTSSEIAKGIHRTSGLLSKLTQLVKRQGLFDDPTEEINNLIYRIKEDLGKYYSFFYLIILQHLLYPCKSYR